MNDLKEADKEKMKSEKENDDPNATNKNEKQNLTLPFVVDLLTQEGYEEQELIQSPSHRIENNFLTYSYNLRKGI
jgi:hypothetical protein